MVLEWNAETLRLSLFFTEPAKATVADWQKITGQDEPQTINNTPARRSMIGPFQGGVLQVNAIGPRIDVVLLPKSPTETIEEGYLPTVGLLAEAYEQFVSATAPWLSGIELCPIRIAVAGTAVARCDSIPDAYQKLLSLLKTVKGDPERMRELIFRVNWPTTSRSLANLPLNRITTWAVIQINLQLIAQVGLKTMVEDTPITPTIRLEVDHNTDAERTAPFDQNVLVPIYEELVALALENAEKGEVL
jgi:hypothetical protein